jgi:hypothetical protein
MSSCSQPRTLRRWPYPGRSPSAADEQTLLAAQNPTHLACEVGLGVG